MCLITLLTPLEAQSGKPKPAPLPPVRYQVQLWTVPGFTVSEVNDTNNQCQTVGAAAADLNGDQVLDFHGFIYDPAIDPEAGIDLNDIVVGIPNGWNIRKATAINEVGQIAAYIEPTGNPTLTVLQAVVIDMNQLPPTLQVIPDRAFTDYSVAGDINDLGYVTARYIRADGAWGHYAYNAYDPDPATAIVDLGVSVASGEYPKINNSGVIVGPLSNGNGYRASLNSGFQVLSGLLPRAINENNAFCGTAIVATTKSKRTEQCAFVYDTSLILNKIAYSALDLNQSLDSVVYYSWLNHGTYGNLVIKDLLDPRDPDSSLISPNCATMTDRDPITNFPVLCGTAAIGGANMGILLNPVPAP
jgi:hypothetical protein